MIHPGCGPLIFSFSQWSTSVMFYLKSIIFSLRGWCGLCSDQTNRVLPICFAFLVFLFLKTLEWKYLIEFLNILEGIHVILFCFLIASGYIPAEFSSSKLPHTVQLVHNKGSYRQSDIESDLKELAVILTLYLKVAWQRMNLVRNDESCCQSINYCQEWNYSPLQNLLIPANILMLSSARLKAYLEELKSRPAVKISAHFLTISKFCRTEISAFCLKKRRFMANN